MNIASPMLLYAPAPDKILDVIVKPVAPEPVEFPSWNGSAPPRDSEGINCATALAEPANGAYSRLVSALQKRP